MKALRKCACVAVQFVVTAALLFQQCPVQAIALGMERGSDYVEIPASEENTGAENDSSNAPSNDGNSNEAVPSTAEKDEAASGADSVVGADNAIQNTQSDDDATNSGDATPASVSDEELVWNRLGTLEWSKDANKNVILRPIDGAATGSYDGTVNSAKLFGKDIKSVKTEGRISVDRLLFGDCRKLESIDISDVLVTGQSAAYMFYRCWSLVDLNISAIDISSVTDTSFMFYACSSLESLDTSWLDTSSVTNMSHMFYQCSSLTSLDLTPLDTSSVRNMWNMFCGCSSLASLDLSSLDTSLVGDMSGLFDSCSSLTSLDLSSLVTSSVTEMRSMFSSCSSITSIDLSSFDTSSVTDMGGMFFGCKSLASINLTSFDTSAVTAMDSMFAGCPCLQTLDVSSFKTPKVVTMHQMFAGCSSLVSLDLSSFDSSCVDDSWGTNMFLDDGSLKSLKLGSKCNEMITAAIPNKYKGFAIGWENSSGVLSSKVPALTADSYVAVADFSQAKFEVDLTDECYTGKAVCKRVSSLDGLKEGEDYILSYFDNVNCGTATVKVAGDGVFRGEQVFHFSINKVPADYKVPTGLKAAYGQKLSDVKLPDGFSWEDPSLPVGDPGENTFRCKYAAPDGNHTGAEGIEVEVRVTRPVEASMFSIDADGLVYTGSAHEPAVTSEVVPGGSYTVSYRDNVAAGKAAALVKGSGFYTGTCEVPFSIAKAKPSYTVPATLKGVYGKKLSDVKLPEGFSWSDPGMRIDWYGKKVIKTTYTPSDAINYEVVRGIEVSVFVGRNIIDVPTIKDLVYSGSVQAPSVSFDGIHAVKNAGGVNMGQYSVELALDDPVLDCWKDGTTENKTVEYRILPADINSADIAPISPCLLKDGKAEPGVSVTFGGQELSADQDFDVSYFDNGKVGTASVTIKGKGNFTGEKTVYFQIAKGDLGECRVTTRRNVYLYKGSAVEPRVFVSTEDGSAVLREGVDYKVTYADNNAVGTGHATINGTGDYIGSKTVDFDIADAIDLNAYCYVLASDTFYTGDEVRPEVDVRLNTESVDEACGNGGASRSEDAPIEGRDYTVSFVDNINPGMATAIVTGHGRYKGEVRTQFRVLRKGDFSLSDFNVVINPPAGADRFSYVEKGGKSSFMYTGSAIEPTVSAYLYDDSGVHVELRNGVDYEVSYRSNTEPGSATVVVRGINGLAGSQTFGFNIVRKLSVADLSLSKYDFEQSAYQLKPGFALAPKLRRSSSFVEGADYNLSYANCDKVGNGLVTVTGIGRYTGSVVVEVPIVESLDRSLLSECSFDKIEDQVYTGSEIYPRVVLRNASGAEVDQIRECSLLYSNNINVGKAVIAARECMYYSSYIGEASTSFNILPANINDAYFAPIDDASYTRNAIEPDVLVRFNGKTLVKGKDYDLSYSDNVKVGTAHVTVTGKGNFNGKHEMTFKIVRPVIEFDQDMVEGKTVSTGWTEKKVYITKYRIVLDRGGMVRIRTGLWSIDSVLCSIQNENGDIMEAWAPSDGGDYGFFALPAGTFYFEFFGSPESYGGSVYASYSMTRFDEPADTIYEVEDNSGAGDGHTIAGDATPIEIGRFFAGSNYYAINGGFGDIDYFKFTVTKRGHYSMSLAANARLMFALTDAQGDTLVNRDTGHDIVAKSDPERLTGLDFGTLEPGTYYVLVLSNDRAAVGSAYYGLIIDSSDPDPVVSGTWKGSAGKWWYQYGDGSYLKSCWKDIDGARYHFDGNGYAEAGWALVDGSWYWFDPSSSAMRTGWQMIGGTWYWFDDSGVMATGWRQVDGSWYLFSGSGAMLTGWQLTGGAWYYLGGSGAMRTGWQSIGGAWYWFSGSGAMATGWRQIDGAYYYFNGSGAMLRDCWVGDYYLTGSGAMATNQWIGSYYVDGNGKWVR